jgi:hypothetical protein
LALGATCGIQGQDHKQEAQVLPVAKANLEVKLDLDPEADAQELDELTRRLRRQLLELDVESVERAEGPPRPPGARAADATSLGTLLVTIASTPELLRAVVGTVREWLSRARCRSVKVKLGDSELDLTRVSLEQQERLISDWIAHHAVG